MTKRREICTLRQKHKEEFEWRVHLSVMFKAPKVRRGRQVQKATRVTQGHADFRVRLVRRGLKARLEMLAHKGPRAIPARQDLKAQREIPGMQAPRDLKETLELLDRKAPKVRKARLEI